MTKYLSSLFIATTLLLTGVAQAATTLYSQNTTTGSGSINSQSVIGGSDYDVYTFATFTPTQSGTVDNISWQGTPNDMGVYAGYYNGFSIDVLNVNGIQYPLPGSVQYAPVSQTVITGPAGLAHGTPNANGMYDYNADVTPFYVQAGVTYHISIRANGIAPWGWASGPGAGTIAYYKGLAKFLSVSGVPVFALNNVHNTVVPPTPVNPSSVTILPVPAPVPTTIAVAGAQGEVQGMITAVGNGYVMIDNATVTYDGDTVKTFHGGLVTFAIGEMVNYSYIVDVDGVIIAKSMDIYPAQAVSGTDRVSGIGVSNATGVVSLPLSTGGAVDFFQNAGIYVSGAGTNTSFGYQLVNYVGFLNPTTGHIVASQSGYMSNLPVFFKSVLPAATAGQSYNQYSIDTSVFGAANIYSLSAAGLPAGLTNNMGSISGIPTTPGTYQVVLTAIGGQWNVAPYQVIGQATTTIVVNPGPAGLPPATPVSFVTNVPNAQVSVAYPATNLIASGVAPYTVTAAPLPAGMTVSSSGILSGTPTTAGTYTINLSATDASSTPGTGTVVVNVASAPMPPIGTTLANGTVGVAYPATSLASPGVPLYMISNSPVTGIPAGMTVSVTGILSGTPAVAGTYHIGFYAIGNGLTLLGNATTTITIDPAVVVTPPMPAPLPAPTVTLTANGMSLINVNAGAAFQLAWNAQNVDSCSQWGNWGAGSAVATSGTQTLNALSPAVVTGYLYEIRCSQGTTTVQAGVQVNVTPAPVVVPADTIAPVITMIGSNAALTAGTSYVDAGASCTDNVDPICTVVTTSTVNTAVAGTYTVTYSATDAAGNSATPVVRTVIVNPVSVVACSATNQYVTGVTVGRSGINPILGWVDVNGGLNNGGQSVKFATAANSTFIAPLTSGQIVAGELVSYTGVMDAGGFFCLANTMTFSQGVTLPGIALANATETVAYTSVAITPQGGIAPYSVSVAGLPSGLIFNGSVVVGTPSLGTTGTYPLIVSASDSLGKVVTTNVSLVVNPAPVVVPVTPVTFITALVNGQVGTAYTLTNLMSTGVAPFTVTATGIPAGMLVSATGNLSGTPTTAGTYTIALSATDSVGTVGTSVVSLTVAPAPVVTPPTTFTSTGVKVDTKGVIASYSATSNTLTLTGGIVLRFTAATKIVLNDGAKLSSVGKKVQYKGVKNTDGSVTLSSIEVN